MSNTTLRDEIEEAIEGAVHSGRLDHHNVYGAVQTATQSILELLAKRLPEHKGCISPICEEGYRKAIREVRAIIEGSK